LFGAIFRSGEEHCRPVNSAWNANLEDRYGYRIPAEEDTHFTGD
jgi:hypothetical protein